MTFLAILGTLTAQSRSPIVRSLMETSAMSMWTDFLNSEPLSVRKMPLLPMMIMLWSCIIARMVLVLPSPIPSIWDSFFLPTGESSLRHSKAFQMW